MEDRRKKWSYQNTIYAPAISRLVSLGSNTKSEKVFCPKNGCNEKLYLTQQLYRHIEEKHREDQLHTRKYSTKVNFPRNYAPSTSATAPNTDDVSMNSENEIEYSNDDHQETLLMNTSESFVDDYLNDKYLKVCIYFIWNFI